MARNVRSGIARLGALIAAVIGLVCLIGYMWDADELVTDRWLPPVAVNTSLCLVLLGFGILLAPLSSSWRDTTTPKLASVEIKVLAGFVIALSLMLLAGNFTYRTNVRFANSVEWIAHTQEVRTSVASLYGSLAGAEVAVRDYVLLPTAEHLQDYQLLVDDVRRELDTCARLTADNVEQQQNLQSLKPVVTARLNSMSAALQAFATFGLPATRAVIAIGGQSNTTRDVRVVTDRMDLIEARLLAQRRRITEHERSALLISLLATLAAASALFLAMFIGIHREMFARRHAERFLDSLFENLPAVVVVKDAVTLRFVRLNQAFEKLFGISKDEVLGKTVYDILSREEADFVVRKDREALAAGALVDIPEQSVSVNGLGARSLHTMKVPILGQDGQPQYLLAISVDITERKLAEQAIVELNDALKAKALQLGASNTELESFSYSISHDLRAPLRAVDGFALMIEEDYSDRLDAEGRRYLAVIRENAARMGALIDDLLAFSRLGRLPVAHQEVNVESLVREVVEEAVGHAAQPTPQIQIRALPRTHGDRALLRQVWTNLVANAIKYSSKVPHPVIEVTGQENATETVYSIRDNGVGFNMEYVKKLFGVFHRLHRADEFSGTGVGLAIVHRVVTRHGGRVWAEGKVNEGAVFSFALPRESTDG